MNILPFETQVRIVAALTEGCSSAQSNGSLKFTAIA